MDEICKQFGTNVKRIRRAREWSQEDLAGRAEINRTYISAIEAGSRNPTLQIVAKIGLALNVPYHALLEPLDAARVGKLIDENKAP